MVFAVASCEDFLDEKPQDAVSVDEEHSTGTESSYESMADAEAALNGAYRKIPDAPNYQLEMFMIGDVMSDNCYVGGDGAIDGSVDMINLSATNSKSQTWWEELYAIITTATETIENIKLMSDDAVAGNEARVEQMIAEAKVLRAFGMFEMVKLFAGIPIVLELLPPIDAENIDELYPLIYPSRASAEEVYAQIFSDLDETEVISLLESKSSGSNRATKGFAYGLLAKAYASMGAKSERDYGRVVEYCDKVIAEGYSMVDDFGSLWTVDAEFTSESIYELNFTPTDGNWAFWVLLTEVDGEIVVTFRRYATITHELVSKFESSDVRLNESVVWAQTPYTAYWSADNYPLAYKIRGGASNIIMMRLADIELLKAEALVELDRLDDAADIVDKYRTRAGATLVGTAEKSDKESMRDVVADERQKELLLEGHRWHDLVRNETMVEVMNAHKGADGLPYLPSPVDAHRSLIAIPQGERDLNPNLTQNPGYGN